MISLLSTFNRLISTYFMHTAEGFLQSRIKKQKFNAELNRYAVGLNVFECNRLVRTGGININANSAVSKRESPM